MEFRGQNMRVLGSMIRLALCLLSLPLVSTQTLEAGRWISLGNALYYLSPGDVTHTYPDARIYCQDLGGDLAQPGKEDVFNLFQDNQVSIVWIGLDDLSVEGNFKWINGTVQGNSFPEWALVVGDRPDDFRGAEDCVEITKRNSEWKWNDARCSRTRGVVCEKDTDVWVTVGNLQYFVSPPAMTRSYAESRIYCQNQGGDLAQPKTEQIGNILHIPNIWIGLNDIEQEGTFKWIDGTVQGSMFPPWAAGSPNNAGGNEDCVHINSNYRWNDYPCQMSQQFACERYIVPVADIPVPILAATSTPFGRESGPSHYLCLVNSSQVEHSSTTTQRLTKHSGADADDTLEVRGSSVPSSTVVAINQTLPQDSTAVGVFSCTTITTDGHVTSVHPTILYSDRVFQPSDGRFTKTVRVGDSVTMRMARYQSNSVGVQWRIFNGLEDGGYNLDLPNDALTFIVSRLEKKNAHVYGAFSDDTSTNAFGGFIRLIAVECPAGRWFPPDCLGICDNCYNGGVCHEQSGTCICPPGFYGKNCLQACEPNHFGWDCGFECGSGKSLDLCAGSQVCMPDPFGCNCLAGYTGVYCNKTCPNGTFGVDCLGECHCSGGANCNIFTGQCPGSCDDGWLGNNCQVPANCPVGYYGEECAQKCNCLNNEACERETGSCHMTKGLCSPQYIHDLEGGKDNCNLVSGCFNICSQTCHCLGGALDCNSVTGICMSGSCSHRWMGDNCQIDRFQIIVEKSNPRSARIHCFFNNIGLSLQEATISLATGQAGMRKKITTDEASNGNASFTIEDIADDEKIYCYYGNVISDAMVPYASVPERQFYVLPQLQNASLEIGDVGPTYAVVRWRKWDASVDSGDGPVTGYNIYTRVNGRKERTYWVPQLAASQSSMKGSQSNDSKPNPTMKEFNVTQLRSDTQYTLTLAVVREGVNGAGPEGLPIMIDTPMAPSTSAPSTTFSQSASRPINQSAVIGPAVGAGVALVIILIIIGIIFIIGRRREGLHKNDGMLSTHKTPSSFTASITNEDVSVEFTEREPQHDYETPGRAFIPLGEFPAFVHKHRHTGFFTEEYNALPPPDIYPQTAAKKEINFQKNRYKNILPYDRTRVKLSPLNGDPDSDYYNASFISDGQNERKYIACQGPNKASLSDFWRLVWEQNVRTIAMFTKLKEGNKIKCHQYWPDNFDNLSTFDDIEVTLQAIDTWSDGLKRTLKIRKDVQTRTIHQFHYISWPDKDVPKHASSLLKVIKQIETDHGSNSDPLLIHCSAGVGRTGVVIGINRIVAEAKKTGMVDVFNFVCAMRENRPYMVQTSEQYGFLYEAILEDLMWKDTLTTCKTFSSRLSLLQQPSARGSQSQLLVEFENLQLVCPGASASKIRSGKMPKYRSKNRYEDILPLERNRVIIRCDDPTDDYINASFVKGFRCSFITTQMPMPNTVDDFWSMILDYKPSCIVMLNELDADKSCAQYWSDGEEAQFGSYLVTTSSITKTDDGTTRSLVVKHEPSQACHSVRHFQLRGWPGEGSKLTSSPQSLLGFLDAVKSSSQNGSDFAIAVHCLSGIGRTGVFCTIMECVAQIDENDTVDVFQTVKILRADRNGLVQNESQYSLIYEVLNEYLIHKEARQMIIEDHADHTYGNTVGGGTENPYEITEVDLSRGHTRQENPVTDHQDGQHAYGNVPILTAPMPLNKSSESVYENLSYEA